jgi:hypothetical protein
MDISVERTTYVHYAKSPIIGQLVVSWDELSDAQRLLEGHEASVHEGRFLAQWRSDCVYVHDLAGGSPILNIGTAYTGESSWVYEVEPTGPVAIDPERGGHLISSRIYLRASVVRCRQEPLSVVELSSGSR